MSIRIKLLALCIALCGACSYSQREDRLAISLQRLADAYLLDYDIVKSSKSDSITDLGGEWVIRMKENQKVISFTNDAFQLAGEEDTSYFKKRLIRNKLLDQEDGQFLLYRAELKLGKGSACDSTECSVYIMKKNDDSLVYIGIYKH